MEIIKQENFDEVIASGITLVDFFANWCGPCRMLAPVLEEVSNDFVDVKFVKVDVDEAMDIANRYGIMSIPTIYLFKDGKAIAKSTGYKDAGALKDFIKENL